MKFTIDTEVKTITLLEEVEWDELVKTLKSLLGDKLSKYTIIPHEVVDVFIPWFPTLALYIPIPYPVYPMCFSIPYIVTCGTSYNSALAL